MKRNRDAVRRARNRPDQGDLPFRKPAWTPPMGSAVPGAYIDWQDTSMEGYRHILGKKVGILRQQVFEGIMARCDEYLEPGVTRDELFQEDPFRQWKWGTFTARVWELLEAKPPVLYEGPDRRRSESTGVTGYVLRIRPLLAGRR